MIMCLASITMTAAFPVSIPRFSCGMQLPVSAGARGTVKVHVIRFLPCTLKTPGSFRLVALVSVQPQLFVALGNLIGHRSALAHSPLKT